MENNLAISLSDATIGTHTLFLAVTNNNAELRDAIRSYVDGKNIYRIVSRDADDRVQVTWQHVADLCPHGVMFKTSSRLADTYVAQLTTILLDEFFTNDRTGRWAHLKRADVIQHLVSRHLNDKGQ